MKPCHKHNRDTDKYLGSINDIVTTWDFYLRTLKKTHKVIARYGSSTNQTLDSTYTAIWPMPVGLDLAEHYKAKEQV